MLCSLVDAATWWLRAQSRAGRLEQIRLTTGTSVKTTPQLQVSFVNVTLPLSPPSIAPRLTLCKQPLHWGLPFRAVMSEAGQMRHLANSSPCWFVQEG